MESRLSFTSLASEINAKSAIKLKLFNLLTLCLATSGLLAPSRAAFAYSVQQQMNADKVQHLVCVKEEQRLVCEVDRSRESKAPQDAATDSESTSDQEAVKSNEAAEFVQSSGVTGTQQLLTPDQQGAIANILLGFIYLVLPSGLCLGIFLYNRYSTYRTAMLHKQVETLERLWNQSTQK